MKLNIVTSTAATTAPGPFGKHRVVEIARVLAVDGDKRQLGEVLAAAHVARAHLRRQRRHLVLHRRRPGHGDVVLAQRDVDLHAAIQGIAQHLDNHP